MLSVWRYGDGPDGAARHGRGDTHVGHIRATGPRARGYGHPRSRHAMVSQHHTSDTRRYGCRGRLSAAAQHRSAARHGRGLTTPRHRVAWRGVASRGTIWTWAILPTQNGARQWRRSLQSPRATWTNTARAWTRTANTARPSTRMSRQTWRRPAAS